MRKKQIAIVFLLIFLIPLSLSVDQPRLTSQTSTSSDVDNPPRLTSSQASAGGGGGNGTTIINNYNLSVNLTNVAFLNNTQTFVGINTFNGGLVSKNLTTNGNFLDLYAGALGMRAFLGGVGFSVSNGANFADLIVGNKSETFYNARTIQFRNYQEGVQNNTWSLTKSNNNGLSNFSINSSYPTLEYLKIEPQTIFNNDVTANHFIGNGSYLTEVCLTNGTGCTATGSTFNQTYDNLINQNCPTGQVVNGTLSNGTLICTTVSGASNATQNLSGTGSSGYLAQWSGTSTLNNSIVFQNQSNIIVMNGSGQPTHILNDSGLFLLQKGLQTSYTTNRVLLALGDQNRIVKAANVTASVIVQGQDNDGTAHNIFGWDNAGMNFYSTVNIGANALTMTSTSANFAHRFTSLNGADGQVYMMQADFTNSNPTYPYTVFNINTSKGVTQSRIFNFNIPISVNTVNTTVPTFRVRKIASQTANLQEWMNETGSIYQCINSSGDFCNPIIASSFVGNGSNLNGVCLSNGTNCPVTSGSTFNQTYHNLLNQNCPTGQVVNGTLANGTLICTADQTGGAGGGFWGTGTASYIAQWYNGTALNDSNIYQYKDKVIVGGDKADYKFVVNSSGGFNETKLAFFYSNASEPEVRIAGGYVDQGGQLVLGDEDYSDFLRLSGANGGSTHSVGVFAEHSTLTLQSSTDIFIRPDDDGDDAQKDFPATFFMNATSTVANPIMFVGTSGKVGINIVNFTQLFTVAGTGNISSSFWAGNVTTTFYYGNSSYVSGVCLSNGTNCPATFTGNPFDQVLNTTSNVTFSRLNVSSIIIDSSVYGTGEVLRNITNGSDISSFLWYPKKASLRAGEWEIVTNGSDIGSDGSFATGHDTRASGESSFALGERSNATDYTSFAGGFSSIANNSFAFAFGDRVTSSGIDSVAFGKLSFATGEGSFAFGDDARAIAPHSFAWGIGAIANDDGINAAREGAAFGDHAYTTCDSGFAIGEVAIAGCDYFGMAIGNEVEANGTASIALGQYLSSRQARSVTIGSGLNSSDKLINNISNSILLGTKGRKSLFVNDSAVSILAPRLIMLSNMSVVGTNQFIQITNSTGSSIFDMSENNITVYRNASFYGDLFANGTRGFTGTCTILGLTSITVQNGLITGCS